MASKQVLLWVVKKRTHNQKLKMRENHRYEKWPSVNKLSQTSFLSRYHTVIVLSLRSVVSGMRERTSNDAIVFRTLAVVDFFGGLAVLVCYRGQW